MQPARPCLRERESMRCVRYSRNWFALAVSKRRRRPSVRVRSTVINAVKLENTSIFGEFFLRSAALGRRAKRRTDKARWLMLRCYECLADCSPSLAYFCGTFPCLRARKAGYTKYYYTSAVNIGNNPSDYCLPEQLRCF